MMFTWITASIVCENSRAFGVGIAVLVLGYLALKYGAKSRNPGKKVLAIGGLALFAVLAAISALVMLFLVYARIC